MKKVSVLFLLLGMSVFATAQLAGGSTVVSDGQFIHLGYLCEGGSYTAQNTNAATLAGDQLLNIGADGVTDNLVDISAFGAVANDGYIYATSYASDANQTANQVNFDIIGKDINDNIINTDNYTIAGISYDPANQYVQITANTLGADNNGYFIIRVYHHTSYETDAEYIARYTAATGGAGTSGVELISKITLPTDYSTTTIGDIALSNKGDLFTVSGDKIYKISAANLAANNPLLEVLYIIQKEDGTSITAPATATQDEYSTSGIALNNEGKFVITGKETQPDGSTTIFTSVLQPATAGVLTLTNANTTVYDGGCVSMYLENNVNASVLPVSFGPISATMVNNMLNVKWSTLTETSNDHFNIEASTDGKIFTTIGTMATKADANGNSHDVLHYSFTKNNMNLPLAAGSFAIIILGGLLFTGKRNRKLLAPAMLVIGLAGAFASCSKKDAGMENNRAEKLLIRIQQVDKNGATLRSGVVQAIQQ